MGFAAVTKVLATSQATVISRHVADNRGVQCSSEDVASPPAGGEWGVLRREVEGEVGGFADRGISQVAGAEFLGDVGAPG